jgi:hypothetical protein
MIARAMAYARAQRNRGREPVFASIQQATKAAAPGLTASRHGACLFAYRSRHASPRLAEIQLLQVPASALITPAGTPSAATRS